MAKVEIVTDDMRAACLEAREEIIRLTEELRRRNVEQLRLRLALSVAFPVLKEYAPHLATLIYAAVEDPTIRRPTLILSNDCAAASAAAPLAYCRPDPRTIE